MTLWPFSSPFWGDQLASPSLVPALPGLAQGCLKLLEEPRWERALQMENPGSLGRLGRPIAVYASMRSKGHWVAETVLEPSISEEGRTAFSPRSWHLAAPQGWPSLPLLFRMSVPMQGPGQHLHDSGPGRGPQQPEPLDGSGETGQAPLCPQACLFSFFPL